MSGKSNLTVREDRARALKELHDTSHYLRDTARGSFLNVADKGYKAGAEKARAAVRPLIGQKLIGGMMGERYYDFHPKESPAYRGRNLPRLLNMAHDFKGILTGLANIEIAASLSRYPNTHRLCLQVAPLAKYPDERWQEYYLARGWEAQFEHPFAVPELAGRSVWIPIDSLREHFLHFPAEPEDSFVIRRNVYTN